jgi:serine phosphatase RsbU (regulator of sigma subunit)/anti-sigma regulatory factor (Ser/Thr protein kinase)
MQKKSLTITRISLQSEFGAIAPVRLAFIDFLLTLGINDEEKEGWKLVFTELLNNAIEHGCAGRTTDTIQVEWYQTRNQVKVSIHQPGTGPTDEQLQSPQLPDDPLAEGGRGLYIIRSFIDDWQVLRGADRMQFTVEKTYPHLNHTLAVNAEVDEILDELSDCYENLTLFHRLGDALKHGQAFGELLNETVQLFLEAGGYDLAHLEIEKGSPLVELQSMERSVFYHRLEAGATPLLERLGTAPHYAWSQGDTGAPIAVDSQLPTGGCAVPILQRNRRVALIAVANHDRTRQVLARDIRNLQSLAEIIGVGLSREIMDRETTAHRIVEHEFELAKHLQRQLLGTADKTATIAGYTCHARSIAALDLAGDHAEFGRSDDGRLLFAIIDVMGKGVSAAILAGIFRSHFLTWMQQPDLPGQLLARVNDALERQLGGRVLFITALVGCIEPATGICHYAGAGHPPALLVRGNGQLSELPSSGPPLGVIAGYHFQSERIAMACGDNLIMVTDGLYEWTARTGRSFNWEALRDWCGGHGGLCPATISDKMFAMIQSYSVRLHEDDQTLLIIQREIQ